MANPKSGRVHQNKHFCRSIYLHLEDTVCQSFFFLNFICNMDFTHEFSDIHLIFGAANGNELLKYCASSTGKW